jgi:hypothetical protein
MRNTLRYLIGLALVVFLMPVRGTSQTPDDKADKVERAHRRHVVKKAAADTKNGVKKGYHKVAHAVMSPIDKAKAHHKADEKSEGETH